MLGFDPVSSGPISALSGSIIIIPVAAGLSLVGGQPAIIIDYIKVPVSGDLILLGLQPIIQLSTNKFMTVVWNISGRSRNMPLQVRDSKMILQPSRFML